MYKNDKDIIDLYKKRKKIWVAAYNQIKMLPEINEVIDLALIKLVSKIANIKVPALTSNYVCRVSLPNNEGTSKTKRHIDYPSHRGSKNALTVWLPLQDTDKKNGSLKIYPGSRKVKTYSGSLKKNLIIRKNLSGTKYEKYMIDTNFKVGQAIMFSHFLIHESGDNTSNTIRFSVDFRLNDLSDKLYAKRNYYINYITKRIKN